MAGNTISITFKLEGDNKTFKQLANDADGLKQAMSGVISEAGQLKAKALNFAAIATGIDQAQQSIQQLMGAMRGLVDAYAVQETAERKLETVMRQRMNATAGEIQSIKDLASAQQEIGVIGDEVQLSGAQQMATFLNQKQSIDVLLPAMNNLLAQQQGLNATTSDAVSVANLMGKAMQGQTSALTRVGITFTEAQAKVMKYGDESQRAAMLAQIITDNVGQMNQELAQTDIGKQKQLENTIGDIKEKLGGLVKGAMPFLTIASEATIALAGVMKLVQGIRALEMSFKGATIASKALKWSLRSLMVATGVGVAIAALTTVIERLIGSEEKAEDETRDLSQEMQRYAAEARDISASIGRYSDAELSRLEHLYKAANDEAKSKQERIKAAKELQNIYPAYFANMSAEDIALGKAKKGYNDLTAAIMKNARVKAAADKIVENEAKGYEYSRRTSDAIAQQKELLKQREEINKKIADVTSSWVDTHFPSVKGTEKENIRNTYIRRNLARTDGGKDPVGQLINERRKIQDSINSLGYSLDLFREKADEITAANEEIAKSYGITLEDLNNAQAGGGYFLPKSVSVTPQAVKEQKTRLQEINDEIEKLRNAYANAGDAEKQTIMSTVAALDSEKAQIEEQLRLFDERDSYDFTVRMSNAEFEIEEGGLDGLADRLNTISELREGIDLLQQKQSQASKDEISQYNQTIALLREKLQLFEQMAGTSTTSFNAEATTLKDITSNIEILNGRLQTASIEEAAALNQEIALWEKKADAIRNSGNAMADTTRVIGSMVGSIGTSLSNLGNAFEMPALNIAGVIAQSIATMIMGYAQATALAGQLGPIAWLGFGAAGLAQLTAIISTIKGLPKFADGGIVSGPTIGLMGEYAGASNNPEVIAPLSELRKMLYTSEPSNERLITRISGQDIEVVLAKRSRFRNRM